VTKGIAGSSVRAIEALELGGDEAIEEN